MELGRIYNAAIFAAYSANQSDFRKRVTSRNTPTRTYTVDNRSHSLNFSHGSSPHLGAWSMALGLRQRFEYYYCAHTIYIYIYIRV